VIVPVKPDLPDHWRSPKYEILDEGVMTCKDGRCSILLNDFMKMVRNHGKCEGVRRSLLEIIENPTYEKIEK